ncbi:hypothetical protein BH11PSE9_BH11PSE9_34100 [soil metagenome]
MRYSPQSHLLATARAGIGFCALTCFVGDAYPDLVRVGLRRLQKRSG